MKPLGGLGNQMFQYAAGLSLARLRGSDLCVDKSNYWVYKAWPFHLDQLRIQAKIEPGRDPTQAVQPRQPSRWEGLATSLRKVAGLRKPAQAAPVEPMTYREPHFHFDPAFFKCNAPAVLEGYFQSERYFLGVADELRERLKPVPPLRSDSLRVADAIAQADVSLSVHVRRGDYANSEVRRVHGILDESYYRTALGILSGAHGEGLKVFLFSDEPDAAIAMFDASVRTRITVVRGDSECPWEDMTLMAQCRHHVIANSSFSWWGAWLDPRPDKTVIAPREWFAPEQLRKNNTCDLYPPQWILV